MSGGGFFYCSFGISSKVRGATLHASERLFSFFQYFKNKQVNHLIGLNFLVRYIEKFIAKLEKTSRKNFMKTRLYLFSILSLFISPFAIYGADAFLFMGTGNSENPANLSDRSQWTYLSTYDSGGDDWNFRVFPQAL